MARKAFPALKPKVVLGIAAHADDLDFGASGTMARFADTGAELHYLIVTDGSKGSSDPNITSSQLKKLRRQEQRAALIDIIGGKSVSFLDYKDGELEVTLDLKRQLVKVIRAAKPDVVITMDPTMAYAAEHDFINHPDHRAAGQAALDAVFPLARDHLAFPELIKQGYQPHITPTVLLINLEKSNYYVDISNTFEKKIEALSAHKSQIADIKAVRQRMHAIAQQHGRIAGCALAEAFVRIDIR